MLHDVISRYSFMDLWPCSSKDLDHLTRQEWLAKNNKKKLDKPTLLNGTSGGDKGSFELMNSKAGVASSEVVYPDTFRMVIYDPRQTSGPELPAVSYPLVGCGNTKAVEEILKVMSPALVAFITNLPAVEGDDLVKAVEDCLKKATDCELAAIDAMAAAAHSLVIPLAIFLGRIGIEEAIELIRLEEYLQVDKWGLVEGGHDVDVADLQVQMSSAAAFRGLSCRQ